MKVKNFFITKDTLIVAIIIAILSLVIFVFYIEIKNNYKIKTSKENFYNVIDEFNLAISKCKIESEWIFGGECVNFPKIKLINDHFNNSKKIKNPYNNKLGVNGDPGSVIIENRDNTIIFYVDYDANGGDDIQHRIKIN